MAHTPPMGGMSAQEISAAFGCDLHQAERILQNQAIAEEREREWRRKIISWAMFAMIAGAGILICIGFNPEILPFGWTLKDVGTGAGVAGMVVGFVATVIF